MEIQNIFKERFQGKIGQVFIYLTDECNIQCTHCLYKPELTFRLERKYIPLEECIKLMESFFSLGATKLTFLGGEPTLYPKLPELIHEAKKIGYAYVRIDTNGQFQTSLLDNEFIRELDELTFSLDGYNEELNDEIRGNGVFKKLMSNLEYAVKKKYNVHITTCVHKNLIKEENQQLRLFRMIEYAESLGVNTINMHDLLKSGIPRDLWSGKSETSIDEYLSAFEKVQFYLKQQTNNISVRMPQCVINKEEYETNKKYYSYCSAKLFDRILVFPNGMLRICSLLIGTPYCIGYYDNENIYWNDTPTNELKNHKLGSDTVCTNQGKGKFFKDKVPLCVSFKPNQNEPIWKSKLKWEEKKK
jgi:MoaA/NifB/PqqE/SkfB family radical SAM enzyme